jgi:hypothetical protein
MLGIRRIRDGKSCSLTMDEQAYLDAMLNKFGITYSQYHSYKIQSQTPITFDVQTMTTN